MSGRLERRQLYQDLVGQVMEECGPDAWFVMADETGRLHDHSYGRITPTPAQKMWARDLLERLNRHMDLDGSWVVCWSDPVDIPTPPGMGISLIGIDRPIPSRCVWFHKDRDSDVNFAIDTEDSLRAILGSDIDERIEHTAQAHKEYRSMLRDIDVQPGQTRKAALGEAPRDPKIKVVPYAN